MTSQKTKQSYNKNKHYSQLQNNSNIKNSKRVDQNNSNEGSNIYLLPLMFVVTILPLIVKIHQYSTGFSQFEWSPDNDIAFDFFLYYKQIFLILTAIIMVIFLLYKFMTARSSIIFPKIFIPLGLYVLLALLSSILSRYRNFSFTGTFEQFESVFAILSYCILAYYSFLIVKSERDLKFIMYALLIGAFVLSLLGLTQVFGHDFYNTDIGRHLISNSAYANNADSLQITVGKNIVYLSLFNPNYVGVYVSILFPIMLYITLFAKKLWLRLFSLLTSVGLIISLYGSASTAGFVSVIVTIFLSLLLLRRYLIKYFYITISFIIIAFLGLFIINVRTNNYLSTQISKFTNVQKSTPLLTDIQTNDDSLLVQYAGNSLKILFEVDEYGVCNFRFQDQTDSNVAYVIDSLNGPVTITDERFPGFVFTPARNRDNIIGFDAVLDNRSWFFTNQRGDDTYYYVNAYGKYDKIMLAPSAVFTGYEYYGSGRGYIWSRTIPLLKNHFLLGSGADTFTFVFPQDDYVNYKTYGYEGQIMSKPHCLYLQIGVQTGVVSLLSFLIFCGWYLISSIKIYFRCQFDQCYVVIGASIFVSTVGYVISGISNDSSITVAPIFWVLIGIGISINQKIRMSKKLPVLPPKS
jgi:hypothetical protein